MSQYTPGEVVNLAFAQAHVIDAGEGFLVVQTAHDELTLSPEQPDLTITRVRPADGLPRPGEVWQDAFGCIWFVRGNDQQTRFVGADEQTQHPGMTYRLWTDVHREAGPLRRIWSPPADQTRDQAAEDEPAPRQCAPGVAG